MQTSLRNEFVKRQNEIIDSSQKLKAAAIKLDRESAVISEAERVSRQRELANQDRDLQRKQREFTEDLNQRTFEDRTKIAGKANQALMQIAKQGNIDVIIQDPAYASSTSDITNQLIALLNNELNINEIKFSFPKDQVMAVINSEKLSQMYPNIDKVK